MSWHRLYLLCMYHEYIFTLFLWTPHPLPSDLQVYLKPKCLPDQNLEDEAGLHPLID